MKSRDKNKKALDQYIGVGTDYVRSNTMQLETVKVQTQKPSVHSFKKLFQGPFISQIFLDTSNCEISKRQSQYQKVPPLTNKGGKLIIAIQYVQYTEVQIELPGKI